ncbi:transferase [Salpingoeca rosetta]|uniref:Elongation of fatty acids protein n=1 Tax=Salpingoeca rosetta (strain ATCC 50818 / BSB-021) TaxID=946362 RepID=F2U784_SALR5|nr:transferase [Salpingoeca rosetta]EGD83301.1 transferase [Salpingoeca rosetta]|eukprot:XP_004994805.1 transferase [Salpingoeca rosetta]
MQYHSEYDYLVQPPVLIGSGIIYVIVAVSLYKFMRSRPAFELKIPMMIYNIAQVVVCAAMTAGLFNELRAGEPIQIPNTSFSVPNLFGLNTTFTKAAEFWVLVHYLSKFLDFFDTIFIALRKKDRQMSFLHVYHHATIGPIWGLLLYLGYGGATACFGACINSFTHVLMYTHYFVSALGIRHPFKPLITSWQIFQFYSCIAHAVLCISPLETVYPKYLAYVQFAYHLTMIVLFTSFFKKTYGADDKKKSKQQAATNGHAKTAVKAPATNGTDAAAAHDDGEHATNGNGKAVRRRRVATT